MTEQFENPEETKVKDETVSNPTAQEKVERVADKAAGRLAKTEQKYDGDHTIFSK